MASASSPVTLSLWGLLLGILCCISTTFAFNPSDIILKPNGTATTTNVGLVLVQGAEIAPAMYVPLATAVQYALAQVYGVSAWVGIPQFPGNMADPLLFTAAIHRVTVAMQTEGLPAAAPLFLAGHSLGGAVMQAYVLDHPHVFQGQILLGAYVLRVYLNGTQFSTPTLTVSGELDGLSRITRLAESYYHQIRSPRGVFTRNTTTDYPITVVMGMSHMQFASGLAPPTVKHYDLQPEISYASAHTQVGGDMASFIAAHTPSVSSAQRASAVALLQKRVKEAGAVFAPLIAGFEMEGSYHLKPPCYDGPHTDSCQIGCPWTRVAQELMGGVERPGLAYNVSDEFHVVSDIHPVHLPHVLNTCTDPSAACVLQCTTVSQAMYDPGDVVDTAIVPVSAYEIRAKLKSRQVVYEHLGLPADFNMTDAPSLCAMINQHAFAWALNISSTAARARYARIGEAYVFGEDLGPYNAGPVWIGAPVVYKPIKNNETGVSEVEVRSPMMKTPSVFIVPAAAGMHYCKLLSPSRALEWIYVDGLRLNGSINSTIG